MHKIGYVIRSTKCDKVPLLRYLTFSEYGFPVLRKFNQAKVFDHLVSAQRAKLDGDTIVPVKMMYSGKWKIIK